MRLCDQWLILDYQHIDHQCRSVTGTAAFTTDP